MVKIVGLGFQPSPAAVLEWFGRILRQRDVVVRFSVLSLAPGGKTLKFSPLASSPLMQAW
jgi:hypothetical protein